MQASQGWPAFRKDLLAGCLIVAPVLFVIAALLSLGVYGGDDEARYLASISENEGTYYASGVIGALGAVTFVGAVLALIHLVRVRYPRYAKAVGGLALLGGLLMGGTWLTFTIVETTMARSADREAMVALLAEGEESALMAPLFVVWIGVALAMLLLSGALFRARTVPRFIPILLGAGFVLLFAGDSDVMSLIANALMAAALIPLGLLVRKASVETWESGELTPPAPPAAATPAAPAPA